MRRRSEKYVPEGSKYAHWIGLHLSFHLKWVLGPFFHGRLQNLQTSEVIFAHVIAPLTFFLLNGVVVLAQGLIKMVQPDDKSRITRMCG